MTGDFSHILAIDGDFGAAIGQNWLWGVNLGYLWGGFENFYIFLRFLHFFLDLHGRFMLLYFRFLLI